MACCVAYAAAAAAAAAAAVSESDGSQDAHSALLTSFFSSKLLDVNVLGIIREYVEYTLWSQTD
jgi:hypothetical protein